MQGPAGGGVGVHGGNERRQPDAECLAGGGSGQLLQARWLLPQGGVVLPGLSPVAPLVDPGSMQLTQGGSRFDTALGISA